MTNRLLLNQANTHKVLGSHLGHSIALSRSILKDCAIKPPRNRSTACGIAVFPPVNVPAGIVFPVHQITANRWHRTILPHFQFGVSR